MVVSMIQLIIELPGIGSIKEKRRIVNSLKDRLSKKYKISVAEVDLQSSLCFVQLGAAIVSNSKRFGESVMQKALLFIEEEVPGRVQHVQILSEIY
ncbi:MAG: DUF503 domain-containing protein [Spirochaetes bacterium]|nr:MAG: DUF503 domain-containing protein [Spirochaetota bacterium]